MPRICTICSEVGTAKFIRCVKCKKHFHYDCVNLSGDDVASLGEDREGWTCSACAPGVRQLRSGSQGQRQASQSSAARLDGDVGGGEMMMTVKHFEVLMDQMRNLTSSMERIERRQDDLFKQLSSCSDAITRHAKTLTDHDTALRFCEGEICELRSSQTALSDNLSSIINRMEGVESSIAGGCSPMTVDALSSSEILDRVKKSYNLIITNAPESANSSGDTSLASGIVEHIHRSSSLSLVSVSRLRSKATSNSKPRWMRLVFSNPEVVTNILRNKASLRAHPEYRDISIQDDKTKTQLATLNAVRQELRERQKRGEKDLTIKYIQHTPRIVNCPQQPSYSRGTKN